MTSVCASLSLDLSRGMNAATLLAGLALDGFCKKRCTALPDGGDAIPVPESFAIGTKATAFLTGSVKGGGRSHI